MNKEDCTECQKEAIQKYIELEEEHSQTEKELLLVQECLWATEKLCNFYRKEREWFKHNYKLLTNHKEQ